MRLVLLGPPGVGKGTQARVICEHFSIPQISTGDMLREAVSAGDALGREAASRIEAGQLVPDPLMVALVQQRLQHEDCRAGFLLDGFPRTLPQAQALEDTGVAPDRALLFEAPDEELVRRLSGRRVHPGSGRTYHVTFNPPQRPGVDDLSGEPLVQREDDAESTVRERLRVYHEQTAPLVSFYRQYAASRPGFVFDVIAADAPMPEVSRRVRQSLENNAVPRTRSAD